jgi:hypothetical protein
LNIEQEINSVEITSQESDEILLNENNENTETESNANTESSREIEMEIEFDSIPSVLKQTQIESIVLRFNNLNTKINVGSDLLELNNLDKATIEISEFDGSLSFDSLGVSLDGYAHKIEVNNVALALSQKEKIKFSDLDYSGLNINFIEIQDLKLSKGDGTLIVPGKLQYTLNEDELKIGMLKGGINIDRDGTSGFYFDGKVSDLSVSGKSLKLDLS